MRHKFRSQRVLSPRLHSWVYDGSRFQLGRDPDIDAMELLPWDQADLYALELAPKEGQVLIVGERFGAVSLGLGVGRCQLWVDSFVSRLAIERNWRRSGFDPGGRIVSLASELSKENYAAVIVRVPRDLVGLESVLQSIGDKVGEAEWYFVGMQKHMPRTLAAWLQNHFSSVEAHPGQKKAKAFRAKGPKLLSGDALKLDSYFLACDAIDIISAPTVFGAGKCDAGTALLLEHLPILSIRDSVVDLGCGSGVIAAVVAKRYPAINVLASDESALAVLSTRLTAERNRLTNIKTIMSHAGEDIPSQSATLVLLNPPFHRGSELTEGIAQQMFAASERILQAGGRLLVVFNNGLNYEPQLRRLFTKITTLAHHQQFRLVEAQK